MHVCRNCVPVLHHEYDTVDVLPYSFSLLQGSFSIPCKTTEGRAKIHSSSNGSNWYVSTTCRAKHWLCIPYNYNYVLLYAAVLVPVPVILVVLIRKDIKYTVTRFPQTFCVPNNSNLAFYYSILLINISLATDTCLLIVILYVVHKVYHMLYSKWIVILLSFVRWVRTH